MVEKIKQNWLLLLPYGFSLVISLTLFYTGLKVNETKDYYEKQAIIKELAETKIEIRELKDKLKDYNIIESKTAEIYNMLFTLKSTK